MSITKQDLADQKELIQADLLYILDGFDDRILEMVCQSVVDRIKILEDELEELDNSEFVPGGMGDGGVSAWHDFL